MASSVSSLASTKMNGLLLATKLAMPSAARGRIARSRLYEKLGLDSPCPLSLITAPAGFGKTTALTAYLEQQTNPVAWLSLDEADNEPGRFLEYVIAALRSIFPNIGVDALSALNRPNPPKVLSLMPGLINELTQRQTPFVLAFDDYHVIHSQDVHGVFNFFVEQQPQNMYFTITSRKLPPLPISRLRAGGQLSELNESDLRFTQNEANQFFRESAGLALTDEDISVLEARTEGWVAGLQLAALSLQGESDPQQFIRAFDGDDRFIADYLTDEVLRLQSDEVRKFLLQTSILDRLSGPLCNAVTGSQNSAQRLQQLERSDMFLIPLDNRRQHYRYHHLFAELLRNQLAISGELEVNQLHQRACEWFKDNGFPLEAMQHALKAESYDDALVVLEKYGHQLFVEGKCVALAQWFEQIPMSYLSRIPRLLMLNAWVKYIGYGQIDEALIAEIEQCARGADTNGSECIDYDLQLMQAFRSLQQRDMPRAITLGSDLVNKLQQHGISDMAAPFLLLGSSYYGVGDVEQALENFQYAYRDAKRGKTLLCLNGASFGVARSLVRQGKLADAYQSCSEALALLQENKWDQQLVDTSWLYLSLGVIEYERNHLQQAEIWFGRAAECAEHDRWDTIAAMVALRQARLAWAQGDSNAMATSLDRFKAYTPQPALLPLMPTLEQDQIKLALMRGDLRLVEKWLEQYGISHEDDFVPVHAENYLILARWLIVNGKPTAAIDLLTKLQCQAETGSRSGDLIEILVLRALANDAQGECQHAFEYLSQAVDLAEINGHVRCFLDEGQPMIKLLAQLVNAGLRSHAANLLSQSDRQDGRAFIAEGATPKLSKKELKTLKFLVRGLSNNEIAEQSFVTVNTVKTHLKNIYSKLDVDSRVQAIQKAQILKLI